MDAYHFQMQPVRTSKEEQDFFACVESLRQVYLQVSQQQQRQYSQETQQALSTVYQWISALKSVQCRQSFKKVCLRNQMAIDLLKQMEAVAGGRAKGVEWPFNEGKA